MAAVVKCLVFAYLLFNVCYCSSPVTELLATVLRLFNDCARFYPHADRNMAENLIVRRKVAVDSVHRLVIQCTEVPKWMLRIFCLLNCWGDKFSTYAIGGKCVHYYKEQIHALLPSGFCQLYSSINNQLVMEERVQPMKHQFPKRRFR